MSNTWTVAFKGEVLPTFNRESIIAEATHFMKLSPKRAKALFSGDEHILKRHLSKTEADAFQQLFISKGMQVYLFPEVVQSAKTKVFAFTLNTSSTSRSIRQASRSSDFVESHNSAKVKPKSAASLKSERNVFSGTSQRYGRLDYIKAAIIPNIVVFCSYLWGIEKDSPMLVFIGFIMMGLTFRSVVLRLHDLNRSYKLAFFLFIPLINSIMSLFLFVIPGTKGDNDYGSLPQKKPVNYLRTTTIIVVIIVILKLLNVFININRHKEASDKQEISSYYKSMRTIFAAKHENESSY